VGKYLITGRSGSGKSSIARELVSRGYPAFDGDQVPGLAGYIDLASGLPTTIDYTKPIDDTKVGFNWNAKAMDEFLQSHDDLMLCGSADNQQLGFHHLFDTVFVLVLDPEEQRRRILSRTEHDYGKVPAMQEEILAKQKIFAMKAIELGAVPVDAMPSVQMVTDSILRYIHEH
jgi:broad-specificity NMP kinase